MQMQMGERNESHKYTEKQKVKRINNRKSLNYHIIISTRQENK